MDSNYVFTQPEPSGDIIDPGADNLSFQPISTDPVEIENIVTSKLQDPGDTYHVQKPHVETDEKKEGPPAYCAVLKPEDEKKEKSKAADKSGSTPSTDNSIMETIRTYVDGITAEQWKKYALITGGVLLGRRILFGGK